MESIISEIIANGVRSEELQKAKNKTEAMFVASRVTMHGKADQLAHASLMFQDAGRVNRLLDEYTSITLEENPRCCRALSARGQSLRGCI